LRYIYLSCALLALSAIPAFCTPVFYTSQSAWLTAVSSPTTLTFDGTGSAVGNYSTAAGFTTGLALPDDPTFVGTEVVGGTAGYSLSIVNSTLSQYYNFGSGNSLWWAAYGGLTSSSALQVTFPTAVNAFSVDLMTYSGSGLAYTVELNNNPSLVYTASPTQGWPNQTFFGMTSDTPITSIEFSLPIGASATPLIDNFSYGAAQSQPQTPELCTFLLIASGLIGMALVGRRVRGLAAGPEPA
jgi:hypothetical protein